MSATGSDKARDAAVSGSTGIEGNPRDPAAVGEVLAGAAVEADADHIREVDNYNRALNLARDAAARPGFTWSHEVVHLINATVMEGLTRDTRGNYRAPGEDVHVGIFTGPSPLMVPSLMDELVDWLRRADREPPLVRSALLHLNQHRGVSSPEPRRVHRCTPHDAWTELRPRQPSGHRVARLLHPDLARSVGGP